MLRKFHSDLPIDPRTLQSSLSKVQEIKQIAGGGKYYYFGL